MMFVGQQARGFARSIIWLLYMNRANLGIGQFTSKEN